MKLAFIVNDAAEVKPTQTTAMLIAEAQRREHEVYVVGVADLNLSPDGRVVAFARPGGGVGRSGRVVLDDIDLIVMRTNPGRDPRAWAHAGCMQMLGLLVDRGVHITNSPAGLQRYASKLALATLPEWCRPAMLVTHDKERARAFIDEIDGPAVVKPLSGTRGQDVFLITPRDVDNTPQILDVVTRDGHAVIQEFVPEGVDGDTRVLLLDGKILEIDDVPAAVRRVPPARDFRSNVHVGGVAVPADITDRMRRVVDEIGPNLVKHGLRFVGLDFVGGQIIEVNVFSPGGLRDAERFGDCSFCGAVLAAYERPLAC